MTPLKDILLHYKTTHQALPAFNIDCFEIFQAIEMAVKETHLPCIVQLSANEDKFIEAEKLFLLVKKSRLEGLPIYLNMDHCHDIPRIDRLVHLGFDMIHFDGSGSPFARNLAVTADLISHLKTINPNLIVEAEFNKINLIETAVDPASYTDPTQAQEFMRATNADLLAPSIGNLHGVNTTLPENIDLDRFRQIVSLIPDKFFTLHGGSGISPDQIKSAINLGIVKININTDLRLQYKKSLIRAFSDIKSDKIYDYLNPAISALIPLISAKLTQFQNLP